jgi:hypothetical protein
MKPTEHNKCLDNTTENSTSFTSDKTTCIEVIEEICAGNDVYPYERETANGGQGNT